jgi:hypothetical protein
MYIDTSKERSSAYIGTFNMDESDQKELKQIRKMVKNLNKDLKEFGYDYSYYVKCQGRGINRTERMKAWLSDKYHCRISDHWARDAGQRSLPLDISDRVDAYIYRRY